MVFVAKEMERRGIDDAAAHRRRDDQPAAHGGEDRAGVSAARPCTCSTRRAPWTSCRACSATGSATTFVASVRAEQAGPAREVRAPRRAKRCCRSTRRAPTTCRPTGTRSSIPVPWFVGRRVVEPSLEELVPFIDWTFFFSAWELKGRFPAILDHPTYGPAGARALRATPRRCSTRIVAREAHHGARRLRLLARQRRSATTSSSTRTTRGRRSWRGSTCCGSRSRSPTGGRIARSPTSSRRRTSMAPDYIGAFAVTAGIGADDARRTSTRRRHDDYSAIIVKALADRLAEAFAEYLHAQARKDWGYGSGRAAVAPTIWPPRSTAASARRSAIRRARTTARSARCSRCSTRRRSASRSPRSCAMMPAASVSGLYFSHPQAKYFNVGRIGRDQLEDYARRKGVHDRGSRALAGAEPGVRRGGSSGGSACPSDVEGALSRRMSCGRHTVAVRPSRSGYLPRTRAAFVLQS